MMTIQQIQETKPDHVKIKLEEIVKLFSSKKLTNTVKIALIETLGKPCDKWSFFNRVLMVSQGTLDARGYQQWLKVGRHVIKGRQSIRILTPHFVDKKIKDKDTGKDEIEKILIGFLSIPVFRYEDTEGKELEKYKPKTVLPLMDVAKKIGIPVEFDNVRGAYGCFIPSQNRIVLASESPEVFYHELGHAIDKHLYNDLKGGQDPKQEATAELTACVLASLYGHDMTNNAWSYIAGYAEDKTPEAVGRLCIKILERVYKIVSFIIENTENKPVVS